MESQKLKIYQNRLIVSDLIFDVLTDKKSVFEALALFPKDNNDISIKCAFDALMHREADEDLRVNIQGFSQTQDELLEEIANTLKENEPLAKNIIEEYLKYHNENILPDRKVDWKSVFKKIKRMINF